MTQRARENKEARKEREKIETPSRMNIQVSFLTVNLLITLIGVIYLASGVNRIRDNLSEVKEYVAQTNIALTQANVTISHIDEHLEFVQQRLDDIHARIDAAAGTSDGPSEAATNQLAIIQSLEEMDGYFSAPWPITLPCPNTDAYGAIYERQEDLKGAFGQIGGWNIPTTGIDPAREELTAWRDAYLALLNDAESEAFAYTGRLRADSSGEQMTADCQQRADTITFRIRQTLERVDWLLQ